VKAFYCDHFVLPLPSGHRFPMEKYAALRRRVATYTGVDLRVPPPVDDEALGRVHHRSWLQRVVSGRLKPEDVRRVGFPWSPELVERSRRSVGGTVAAARAALADGTGANLAGGTHHAFAHRAEGFCVFNDVAVAVRTLQAEGRIGPAAVLDLDVHQGNGTAAIFEDDATVFTTSVHGARNFPFQKTRSDLDVELPDGAGDDPYLDAVDRALEAALEHRPDLLFYVAGADPWEGDRLGRLAVSLQGLGRRDRRVFEVAGARGVPVAVVMAGGYGDPVAATVEIHATTVRHAAAHARPRREERAS
jgi:acetoin utilization deacetylase AcuC-like enzyme